jgi:hypothetical protein
MANYVVEMNSFRMSNISELFGLHYVLFFLSTFATNLELSTFCLAATNSI